MNALRNLLFAFLTLLALIPALPAHAQDATKPVISVTGEVLSGSVVTINILTQYDYSELYFTTSNGVMQFPTECSQNTVGGVTCPYGASYDFKVTVPDGASELWIFARTTFVNDIRQTEQHLPIEQGPMVFAFEEKEVGLSENSFAMNLYLQNLQGRSFATIQSHVLYDPNGLKLLGVEMTSSVPTGSELILNAAQEGDLIFGLSAPASEELRTGGDILRFHFRPLREGSWNVALSGISVDEGKFPVEGRSAQVNVTSTINVRGHVVYGLGTVTVPGVHVATDPDYGVTTETDTDGNYSLSLPSSASFFSPRFSKVGDLLDSISAYDAALTARCAIGFTGACYVDIMDVTGNGDISLLDAREILRYNVGLPTTSTVGQWRFFGNEEPQLPGDRDGIRDSSAWIMGDASMNWGQSISVASMDDSSSVGLYLENGILVFSTDKTATSIQFVLDGAREILSAQADGWTVEHHGNHIALFSADGMPKKATINMSILADAGSMISANHVRFDEELRLYVTNTVIWPSLIDQGERIFLPAVIR